MRRAAPALLAALALTAAGCGGGSDKKAEATATPKSTPTATATATADSAAAKGKHLTDLSKKPIIATPSGQPPAQLMVKDLVKGKGKAAKPGDTISVQYVGTSWSNGQEFDASWDRGQPFSFQLGAGMVIPGWDQGLKGMKVGGRRELIIPPDLGYGPQGSPPAIGPNETLVFVVDLKKVG
jgi:peptidylprolyl isomerase